jgi:hypothetical protein
MNSKHLSRIGAVAVSLGLGTIVATGGGVGVASAAPGDATGSTSSSSSGSSSTGSSSAAGTHSDSAAGPSDSPAILGAGGAGPVYGVTAGRSDPFGALFRFGATVIKETLGRKTLLNPVQRLDDLTPKHRSLFDLIPKIPGRKR